MWCDSKSQWGEPSSRELNRLCLQRCVYLHKHTVSVSVETTGPTEAVGSSDSCASVMENPFVCPTAGQRRPL